MIPRLKHLTKDLLTKTIWAYGSEEVVRQIRKCGLESGTTLVVHSSWHQHNGFRDKPADLIKALKTAVGNNGLLVMTSMPYHNMSSAEWLAKGKPMNVRRSPSMMGLVSEVFRRSEGVHRSLSATHPLLAWGKDAQDFISGHQDTDRPFGPQSPFSKLLERNALILGFDAPFSTFTFTHFVEDHLVDSLPTPLYEPELLAGKVVDYDGNESTQWLRVISPLANKQRREERLIAQLESSQALHRGRIGNTALVWIRAQALLTGAQKLALEGTHFFDHP
ncbi:AAC(3) family N-acetyltransferase [Dechloromonas denitrificans]|uniref:AAC(3) family N-acetyltransferase n=1 Tax=Dechloromonas denitrificans TaxID=281362 RepID=UPI0009F8D715|nr:AAC(3) family N-acetyltransferase [Dechloromonas denitrificans]